MERGALVWAQVRGAGWFRLPLSAWDKGAGGGGLDYFDSPFSEVTLLAARMALTVSSIFFASSSVA